MAGSYCCRVVAAGARRCAGPPPTAAPAAHPQTPLLGHWSDLHGRKPFILFSQVGLVCRERCGCGLWGVGWWCVDDVLRAVASGLYTDLAVPPPRLVPGVSLPAPPSETSWAGSPAPVNKRRSARIDQQPNMYCMRRYCDRSAGPHPPRPHLHPILTPRLPPPPTHTLTHRRPQANLHHPNLPLLQACACIPLLIVLLHLTSGLSLLWYYVVQVGC